jgi:hypothetical protein
VIVTGRAEMFLDLGYAVTRTEEVVVATQVAFSVADH